jgi:hypothetical protein
MNKDWRDYAYDDAAKISESWFGAEAQHGTTEEAVKQGLAERFAYALEARNFTQDEACERTGLSSGQISEIESGRVAAYSIAALEQFLAKVIGD